MTLNSATLSSLSGPGSCKTLSELSKLQGFFCTEQAARHFRTEQAARLFLN